MHAIGSMSQQRHILDTELGIIHGRSPPVCASRSHSDERGQCQFSLVTPNTSRHRYSTVTEYRPTGFLFLPLDQHISTGDAVRLLPSSIPPASDACMNQDILLT